MNFDFKKIKKNLEMNGFFYAKDFFNEDEVSEILNDTNPSHKIVNSKNKKISVSQIYNYKNFWKIIRNKKILNFLRNTMGDDLCYLYNSHSIYQENNKEVDNSWHRDNPCRIFGVGPDWNSDNYDVIRIGIYLSDRNNCQTGLSVLPKTHNQKEWICKLLKILRINFKRLYFNKIFRLILDKILGSKKIYTGKGDCIFFFANIYHASMKSKNDRRAIFLSYGKRNNHAENYLNYFFHHRKGFEINGNMINKIDLKNYLNEENIYIEPPKRKKNIEGASN